MHSTRTMAAALILLLVASACSGPSNAQTPEACDGAVEVGAREKLSLDSILPCLKDPALVSEFMSNNVTYDPEYDFREANANEYPPASVVYERGIDDADGCAILTCYLLERNGWNAVVLGLSIEGSVGSNVCAITESDDSLLVLEGGGRLAGPFPTLDVLVEHYAAIGWMEAGGTVRGIQASQIERATTNDTSPSVMELPWSLLVE